MPVKVGGPRGWRDRGASLAKTPPINYRPLVERQPGRPAAVHNGRLGAAAMPGEINGKCDTGWGIQRFFRDVGNGECTLVIGGGLVAIILVVGILIGIKCLMCPGESGSKKKKKGKKIKVKNPMADTD